MQFRRYVAVTADLAAAAPGDGNRQWEAGQAQGWLADALRTNGRVAEARQARTHELGIYAAMLAADPRRADVRMAQARTQEALAELDLLEGDVGAAVARTGIALADLEEQIDDDPDNGLLQSLAVSAANRRAEALALAGQWAAAAEVNDWAADRARRLVERDPLNRDWQAVLRTSAWLGVAIGFGLGDRDGARQAMAAFARSEAARGAGQAGGVDHLAPIMVLSLGAADALAGGAGSAAGLRAQEAAGLLGHVPDDRAVAMIAALRATMPDAGLPAVTPAGRYPAERLLEPVLAPAR